MSSRSSFRLWSTQGNALDQVQRCQHEHLLGFGFDAKESMLTELA